MRIVSQVYYSRYGEVSTHNKINIKMQIVHLFSDMKSKRSTTFTSITVFVVVVCKIVEHSKISMGGGGGVLQQSPIPTLARWGKNFLHKCTSKGHIITEACLLECIQFYYILEGLLSTSNSLNFSSYA